MAEEKEDFSAVTNNNDRNNFFALQEVWPPHRPHCLDSSRRRRRRPGQPFPSSSSHSNFTRISAATRWQCRGGGVGGSCHNDITCQNATITTSALQSVSPSVIGLREREKRDKTMTRPLFPPSSI